MALEYVKLKKQFAENNSTEFSEFNFQNDHLVHGDYHDHNVFFGPDGTLTHVFDLEKSGYEPRFYELFRSTSYTFLNAPITDKKLRDARLYLDSYRKIYPLDQEEISRGFDAYIIKMAHGAWVETEHYIQNNNRIDPLLDIEYHRFCYFIDHRDKLKQALLG